MEKRRVILYGAVVILAIAHQDFWFWDDATLLWNFLPVGLAYHAGVSICASLLWTSIVLFAWPSEFVEDIEGEETA